MPLPTAVLESYVVGGGGVNLRPNCPWIGVDTYTNAAMCIEAKVIVDQPFGTSLLAGDTVSKSSCTVFGPGAYAGAHADSSVIAEWQQSPTLIFAFTHGHGLGRVYVQAQMGQPPYRDVALDLLVAGIQWAGGMIL